MDDVKGKRITLKRRVPNPLIQGWLEELLEEATAKKSKLVPMLQEALTSIYKHPLPMQSGADCAILKGFDRRLCLFLDKRLEVYNSREAERSQSPATESSDEDATGGNIATLKSRNSSGCSLSVDQADNSNSGSTDTRTKAKVRIYKPSFRSGSYGILRALLEHSKENQMHPSMKKAELIEKAQQYSEESFTRPKPESFYTAWSSMSTLLKKDLVKKVFCNGKAQYLLTNHGVSLATDLLNESKNIPTVNDIIFKGASTSNKEPQVVQGNNKAGAMEIGKGKVAEPQNKLPQRVLENKRAMAMETVSDQVVEPQINLSDVNFIDLPTGSFDIILLIDKNETGGVSKQNDPTVSQFNKYPDLKCEYRSLKVGDFTWIARHRDKKTHELVLPYIVERKRMDDLGSSIKDGRFHEQKFRLRKCGIKNVVYLVENYGSNKHVGLPIQSLRQALANTRVQDGFKVHTTDSLKDSVQFLAMMTNKLTIEYKDKCLIRCNEESEGEVLMTFQFFNESSKKNKPLTVTDTFIKLLLQLKGVSVEKALAITRVYSTPRLLIKEYQKCTEKEGETLLANLKYNELTQNVGPQTSKAIYQLLTKL